MLNKYNYFEASKGTFKALPWELVKLVYYTREVETEGTLPTIKLGNRVFEPNFESVSWRSESYYWVSEDGEWLLRISDHWSEGSAINNCGWIRSCWWKLGGGEQHGTFNKKDSFQAGVIKFKDMKEV